jgi:transposase
MVDWWTSWSGMEVVGMEFRELRDEQWELVQPLLPPRARTGRPRAEDRRTLNGILITWRVLR